MDMKVFKLDIDELISTFAMGNSTTLAEMKKIWLSMKFSFIFEASPSCNQACFMQSLYTHSIGFLVSSGSMSHRLGGLYCLYCLFETQPFKPPFKIYLSLGELKRLQDLIVDAKTKDIKVVSSLVKHMLQRNMFLFGCVDINECSAAERVNELTVIQNARVQLAYKKLFANTRLEQFIHMDLGRELGIDVLKRKSTEYAATKKRAITEASRLVDVGDIKHLTQNEQLIGDTIEKTAKDWDSEKEVFYQQTGTVRRSCEEDFQPEDHEHSKRQKRDKNSSQKTMKNSIEQENGSDNVSDSEDDEDFDKELEDALFSQDDKEDTDDSFDCPFLSVLRCSPLQLT